MAENADKPNFLGIGAQKSGTSWLAKQLSKHPEIWMTPIVEVDESAIAPPNRTEAK